MNVPPIDPDVTQPPATLPAPDELTATTGPAAAAPPGYEVLGELGRGGMGVVYKARQVSLNRVVALKMILAGGHAGAESLARFRSEAESIARLVHPGIVQVYEVGEQNGLPWFSLEYCDGGNLERKLAGTPLPPGEAAALVEALARAAQAAHDKGVVHRDLKPANVLMASGGLTPPGAAHDRRADAPPLAVCIPKLTDFGLARKLDEQGQTRTGSVMGTPSYMAPEQASGSKEVGPAADVWALGAILYECLTGRPPFRAATSMDTILQVISDEPVPPSRLVAKLPRDLETITLKCLQKQPQARYASAAALADDLAAFREGRPIAARPVGAAERLWRWARRNRGLAIAAGVAVLALSLGTVVSTIFGLRATALAEEALQEAKRADENATAADAARAEEARRGDEVNAALAARQREVLALTLSRGQQLLASGDPVAALPWFAEACRIDPGTATHRQRLGRVLQGLPLQLWRLGASINHLAVSPDRSRLAAADNAGTVRVWDVESGEPVGPALRHRFPVLALAFSPDGKHLATAGGLYFVQGEIRVWDPASGKQASQITGRNIYLWVGFSGDGKRLYGADYSAGGGLLRLRLDGATATYFAWERDSFKLLEQVSMTNKLEPTAATMARYIHPRSGRLLVAEGKQARVVVLGEKRALAGPWAHDAEIWCARISPDGRYALTYANDGSTKLRDLEVGREFAFATGHNWIAREAGFPAEEEVALTFFDGAARHYALSAGPVVAASLERPGSRDWLTEFSDDGAFLVGATREGKTRVWRTPGWQPASPWLPHGDTVTAMLPLRDGRWLATGTADGTVRVWNLARSEQLVSSIGGTPSRSAEVSFDPEGRAILVGGGGWWQIDLPPGAYRGFKTGEPDARATALSPSGKLLAVGTSRGVVRLVDLASGKDVRPPLEAGAKFVHDVRFSPDGRWFATRAAAGELEPGNWLGEARVFETATGKQLAKVMTGRSVLDLGGVTCIAVCPEGRYLAAGAVSVPLGRATDAAFAEVRLVEPRTGATVRGFESRVGRAPMFVAFSPDRRRLAVVSALVPSLSGEISIWDYLEGKELFSPIRPAGRVADLAFDPEGKRLAVACGNEVQVWDVVEGRPLFRLPHGEPLAAVRYSGGGRVLVGVAEREVATWDARTGEGPGPAVKHAAPLFTAGVSPDGRWLLSLSNRGETTLHDLIGAEKSADDLARLVRVLSGQSVVGTTTSTIPPDALAADWRKVRDGDPAQLTSTPAMRSQWHSEQLWPLVNAGAWRGAIRQFEQVEPAKGEEQFFDYQAGTCLLAAGDREGLRRRCLGMLRRAEKTKAPRDVELAVKLSLLLPETAADTGPVAELARQLEKVEQKDPLWPWFVLTAGLAHHRAGRHEKAVGCLERVRRTPRLQPAIKALGDLLLAMTRARQGKGEEARKLLADVDRVLEAAGRSSWIERVHLKFLREEARGVVEGREKK
jgi:WD40 repeat protein